MPAPTRTTPFDERWPGDAPATSGSRVVGVDVSSGDRTYATLIHLMLPIATVTVLPMILGPLVMWLVRKDESAFIADHGKEALNFNLTILLYLIGCGVLVPVCGTGLFLLPVVWLFAIICSIIAAIAANRGEFHRYPACVRLIG
jgi:uncharacterized Tic20 family protein